MILVMFGLLFLVKELWFFMVLDFKNVRGAKAPYDGLKIGQTEPYSRPNGPPILGPLDA